MKYINLKRTIIINIILLTLLLALPFNVSAEENTTAKDFTGNNTSYETVLYDNSNGLPTSEANAIAQTEEGFIWIGGYSGLIRYDGNHFNLYQSQSGIASVMSLFVDSKGRLLIGTNDSGLAVLENNEFTFYNHREGLRNSSVRSMVEDDHGNVLMATMVGVAYLDSNDKVHMLDDARINSSEITKLARDNKGNIYGVAKEGDIFTITDLKVTSYYDADELGLGVIQSIFPDPDNDGYIYLGTESNRIIYGKADDGFADHLTLNTGEQYKINEIEKINDKIWICTNNGAGYFEGEEFVAFEDLPVNNSVDHIMPDHEGNLWFTSSRQGVAKIVENRFVDISALADLDPLVVNSTYRVDDVLYIACEEGLLAINDKYEKVENSITKLLKKERIRSILPDSKGNLWCSSTGDYGVVRYNPKSDEYRIYTPDDGLASNKPRLIKELSNGDIAVATSAGLNIIHNGEITAKYNQSNGITNVKLLSLEEGRDGTLYMGTDGGGIFTLKDDIVHQIGLQDGLPSEIVMRMKMDPINKDIIWLICSNAIAYLSGGKVTTISHFPYSNNFDLYLNNLDEMWVLSGNGIYVANREDLLNNNEIKYFFHDSKSGLPCIATANSYSHLLDDGTLYISGSTGVAKVNINDVSINNVKLKMSVPYVSADDVYYPVVDGEVSIPADTRRLNIYAYTFTYSLSNPYISYYLDGFDSEPIYMTRDKLSEISYTNLAGGEYTFHLSQVDLISGENVDSLQVNIIKEKAIYEKTWFRMAIVIGVVACIAGVVAMYFQAKTEKLEKKERENRELVSEICNVFAKTIDLKDKYTNGHSTRVAKYSCLLAEKMGKSEEEVEKIHNIALLHDIGKIGIPDNILNKPGKLTDEEFAVMKSHAQRGFDILKEISIAPDLAIGAGYHHEKIDGTGYPNGLTGKDIPEFAQIIAVADTYDAMHSTRVYRKGLSVHKIAEEMKRVSGTQLNENAVNAMLELIDEGVLNDSDL